MRNTLREFLKLSRPLHSVSVVAKQAPLALSNAKVSCKHGLWLVARVNYEKHAPRVSQVIAAVAKVSCKHGLWLVARVKKTVCFDGIIFIANCSFYFRTLFYLQFCFLE